MAIDGFGVDTLCQGKNDKKRKCLNMQFTAG